MCGKNIVMNNTLDFDTLQNEVLASDWNPSQPGSLTMEHGFQLGDGCTTQKAKGNSVSELPHAKILSYANPYVNSLTLIGFTDTKQSLREELSYWTFMDDMICYLDFLHSYPQEDVGGYTERDSKIGYGLINVEAGW